MLASKAPSHHIVFSGAGVAGARKPVSTAVPFRLECLVCFYVGICQILLLRLELLPTASKWKTQQLGQISQSTQWPHLTLQHRKRPTTTVWVLRATVDYPVPLHELGCYRRSRLCRGTTDLRWKRCSNNYYLHKYQ